MSGKRACLTLHEKSWIIKKRWPWKYETHTQLAVAFEAHFKRPISRQCITQVGVGEIVPCKCNFERRSSRSFVENDENLLNFGRYETRSWPVSLEEDPLYQRLFFCCLRNKFKNFMLFPPQKIWISWGQKSGHKNRCHKNRHGHKNRCHKNRHGL